ncbi:MAG: hypothetical protein KatS3mg054_0154 [Chloroflexus sp.]|nr:MAG: hypothetical protein KatS3mg054_0154 [Chloroflexus sp.]
MSKVDKKGVAGIAARHPTEEEHKKIQAAIYRAFKIPELSYYASIGYLSDYFIVEGNVPFMASVYGKTVIVAEKHVNQATPAELMYTLLHEWTHAGCAHSVRLAKYLRQVPDLARTAAEYEVDSVLRDAEKKLGPAIMDFGDSGIRCPAEFLGWPAEKIIKHMLESAPQQESPAAQGSMSMPMPQDGSGQGSESDSEDSEEEDGAGAQAGNNGDAEEDEDEDEGEGENEPGHSAAEQGNGAGDKGARILAAIKDAIESGHAGHVLPIESKEDAADAQSMLDSVAAQAAVLKELFSAASGQGLVPGAIKERISEAIGPLRESAEDKIRNFLSSANERADWRKVSYKYITSGVVYPKRRPDMPAIAVIRDTSGSMNQELLAKTVAIIADSLAAVCQDGEILLVDADDRVCNARYVSPLDLASMSEVSGRGGTRYAEAIKWVQRFYEGEIRPDDAFGLSPNSNQLDGLVYITDLEIRLEYLAEAEAAVKVPFLWIVLGESPYSCGIQNCKLDVANIK